MAEPNVITVPGPFYGQRGAVSVEHITLAEHRAIVAGLEAQLDALVEQVDAYRRREQMRRANRRPRRATEREAF